MGLPRHTAAWYERLATFQEGYYYPWRSQLGAGNGEDEYLAMIHQHLQAEADVLDAACGHGKVALGLAPHSRSVLGYDRTAAWIELAQQSAQAQRLTNITFVCHDSSAEVNGGQPRLPAPDNSFDLLVCRKGPFHWIEDARRVARPGATLLMLVPDATPPPAWNFWLPETLRLQELSDPYWARPAIEQRLAVAGLTLHSWWSFDVPELFPDPQEMYTWLAWGYSPDEVPSFAEVYPVLEKIFTEYGAPEGVTVRHRQYLWKAVIPPVHRQ